MKKILMFIVIGVLCILNVCTYAMTNIEDAYLGKSDFYLIGSINNKYPIQMQLSFTKNNKIEGVYFYESVNDMIQLSGTLKNDILILEEKGDRGLITAVFNGKLVNNKLYTGIWSSKVSQKQFPFQVEQVSPKTCTWEGKWERVGYYYSPADLTIKKIKSESIKFEISASSGGNLGEINGIAKINGNIATYRNQKNGTMVILKNYGNTIEVITNGAAEHYDCGMAVVLFGIYKKGPLKKKVPTLYECGYFDLITQDQIFRKLVKDDYDSFVLNFHLPDYDNCKDIDNLKAEVISGFVRGCPSMRAIIMYTNDNRFWAAVTKDNGINYYTNTELKTVPKTIQAWVKIVADCCGDTNIHWVK
jgi:hypothetical protein